MKGRSLKSPLGPDFKIIEILDTFCYQLRLKS